MKSPWPNLVFEQPRVSGASSPDTTGMNPDTSDPLGRSLRTCRHLKLPFSSKSAKTHS
jgi:hypothetical protein